MFQKTYKEGFMTEKEMRRFSKGTNTGKKILISKHLQRTGNVAYDGADNSFLLIGEREDTSKNFVIPNMKECNSSYIVIDPDGEIYEQVKDDLDGYTVISMDLSTGMNGDTMVNYNPFHYTRTEADVMDLIDYIVKNDPFTNAKKIFFAACIFHFMENHDKLSFYTLQKFMHDFTGNEFEEDNEDKLSTKYYNAFVNIAAREETRRAIVNDCTSHLLSYAHIGRERDELRFTEMMDERIALFIFPPKKNWEVGKNIISLLLQQVCDIQEERMIAFYQNKAPKPKYSVNCVMMDVKYSRGFDLPRYSSIMRKYGVNFTVSVSTMSRLEDAYDDWWKTVVANLHIWIFYNSYAKETLRFVSKKIGYITDFSGEYSLLPPDELEYLTERGQCLILQRKQKPAIDDLLTVDVK